MEAKLYSVTESALNAARELVTMSDGDPAALLLHAGDGIDSARDLIYEAAENGSDPGEAYFGLATMALLACAAHHELKGT